MTVGNNSRPMIVWSLGIVAILGVQMAGEWALIGTYIGLAAWAMSSVRGAIVALALSWLIGSLNSGLFPTTEYSFALRWLVIGSACARTITTLVLVSPRIPVVITLVLGLFVSTISITSSLTGFAPTISLLKAITFFVGVITILYSVVHIESHGEKRALRKWMTVFFGTVIILSVPLLVYDVGYHLNRVSFQGLTGHPQTFGVFLVFGVAYMLGMVLQGELSATWGILIALVGCGLLVATESRTAAFALAGGILVLVSAVVGRQVWKIIQRRRIRRTTLVAACAIAMVVSVVVPLAGGSIVAAGAEFVAKHRGDTHGQDLQRRLTATRAVMVMRAVDNIQEHPITGIGFGVPSNLRVEDVTREPIFGLPVSAPVEKGVAPVAIVEEVGVVGSSVFALFLIVLLYGIIRQVDLPAMCIVVTVLLVNFGESIMFSFGGNGLLMWIVVGIAWDMARPQNEADVKSRARYGRRRRVGDVGM